MVGGCNLAVEQLVLSAGVSPTLVDELGKIVEIHTLGALLTPFHTHERKSNSPVSNLAEKRLAVHFEVIARHIFRWNDRLSPMLRH